MSAAHRDLILRGGRVIDPSQNIDRITDVRFTNGVVAAIGDKLSGDTERDFVRVVGAEIEPGGAVKSGGAFRGQARGLQLAPENSRLGGTADDGDEGKVSLCERPLQDWPVGGVTFRHAQDERVRR